MPPRRDFCGSAVEGGVEREIFIDNLLVRVYWIIEMIVVERPCAMGVLTPDFQVASYLPSQGRGCIPPWPAAPPPALHAKV